MKHIAFLYNKKQNRKSGKKNGTKTDGMLKNFSALTIFQTAVLAGRLWVLTGNSFD